MTTNRDALIEKFDLLSQEMLKRWADEGDPADRQAAIMALLTSVRIIESPDPLLDKPVSTDKRINIIVL